MNWKKPKVHCTRHENASSGSPAEVNTTGSPHLAAPGSSAYLPGAQATHAEAPGTAEYVPTAQNKHSEGRGVAGTDMIRDTLYTGRSYT
jgi:hypothetical protein